MFSHPCRQTGARALRAQPDDEKSRGDQNESPKYEEEN